MTLPATEYDPEPSSPSRLRISYDDFLALGDGIPPAEWVDGEAIFMTPASSEHQDVVHFLGAAMRCLVESRRSGVVRVAPFQMKTSPDSPGREPDILFVSAERRDLLQRAHLAGPADLAIEVVSPESLDRDRGAKFREYERGGVREYWIIDPERSHAEFYGLAPDGHFHAMEPDGEGVFRSEVVPGLWLRVDWLWQRPLPDVLTVLKAWGLV